MANLTKEEVKHVAKLSKLHLTENEIATFTEQLGEVIGFVKKLDELDLKDVAPTSQTTGATNSLRDDSDSPACLTSEQALSGTESTKNGYFKVPYVFEKK